MAEFKKLKVGAAHDPVLNPENQEHNSQGAVPALVQLLPCPFCGGPVKLEEAEPTRDRMMGVRRWWGVVCRNTINLGGSCAIQQRPSASEDSAIQRWNMRGGKLNDMDKEGCDDGAVLQANEVTQEGWYWWRWLPTEPWGVGMVKVILLHGRFCIGERPDQNIHGEFIGPLTPPK